MKENFSKRVQLIIKQSKEEAIRLGHSYVGSEHLLMGLLNLTGLTLTQCYTMTYQSQYLYLYEIYLE